MIKNHYYAASRAVGHVFAKTRRITVGDTKGHITQAPLAAPATIYCKPGLMNIALSLTY
ncbi:hypothetical protein D3C75_931750 [compost metagenome]